MTAIGQLSLCQCKVFACSLKFVLTFMLSLICLSQSPIICFGAPVDPHALVLLPNFNFAHKLFWPTCWFSCIFSFFGLSSGHCVGVPFCVFSLYFDGCRLFVWVCCFSLTVFDLILCASFLCSFFRVVAVLVLLFSSKSKFARLVAAICVVVSSCCIKQTICVLLLVL